MKVKHNVEKWTLGLSGAALALKGDGFWKL
jgi:hypothetical protein